MKVKNCTWAMTNDLYLNTRLNWEVEIGPNKTLTYEEWRDWEGERVSNVEYGVTDVEGPVTDEEIDEYGEKLHDFIDEQDCTEYPDSPLEDIISFDELIWFEEYINNKDE